MKQAEINSLSQQLEQWHLNQEHQRIVDTITVLSKRERTYELVCQFARALNNLQQFAEAIKQLKTVRKQGASDPLWHYRLGYAYFYLDQEAEALPELEAACSLDPNDEDAWLLLQWCCEILEEESTLTIPPPMVARFEEEKKSDSAEGPDLYDQVETKALEAFIESRIGHFGNVFHEIVSPDIHVDIAIIEPTAAHNYYTLVTMGMGAHKMNVPDELKESDFNRAELLICLPTSWDIHNNEEKWYWPLRWLKILARLPGEEDTWLGFGHTIPNGEPFADNTELSSVVLISPEATFPQIVSEEASGCRLPNGELIQFYQLMPLYDEELAFKMEHTTETLIELMKENDVFDEALIVQVRRKNVCKDT